VRARARARMRILMRIRIRILILWRPGGITTSRASEQRPDRAADKASSPCKEDRFHGQLLGSVRRWAGCGWLRWRSGGWQSFRRAALAVQIALLEHHPVLRSKDCESVRCCAKV